ncbi:hypothetical protein D918_03500 [Trichuris suis]|nr:hypothetical protein D918_03500 [Trichuris suis]
MTSLKTRDPAGLARSFKRIIKLRKAGSTNSIPDLSEGGNKSAMKHAISEKSLRDRVKLGKNSMKQIAAILIDKTTRNADHLLARSKEEACSTDRQVRGPSRLFFLFLLFYLTSNGESLNDKCNNERRICFALNELMNKVDCVLVSGKIVDTDCEMVDRFAQRLHAIVQSADNTSPADDYVHEECSKHRSDQTDGEETLSETCVGNTIVKVKKVRKKQVSTTTVVKKSERIVSVYPELSQEPYGFCPQLSPSSIESTFAGGINVIETEVHRLRGLKRTEYKTTGNENGMETLFSMSSNFDATKTQDEANSRMKSPHTSRRDVHIRHIDQRSDQKTVSRKVLVNGGTTEVFSTDETSRKLELSKRSMLLRDNNKLNVQEEHFSSESNTFEINGCDESFNHVNFRDVNGSAKANMHMRKTDGTAASSAGLLFYE